ncbi:MAG: glutathione S-transferase N-terminal domain-containing protein [Pseudomonadota bacterium]
MTEQKTPIDLFFWPTPNGFKVTIYFEETGIPYTVYPINIGKGDQFKPDFLKIAPNNRMPAIIDPEGPGGEPISIFESGAILQYLGRKFGQFYPTDERSRVKVEEWLMWQMGGFGPMLGQNHHFNTYAPEDVPYAKKRYTDETHRLYGVLNKQLNGQDYIAGDYSIADMACIGWARGWEKQQMDIAEFPNLERWMATMMDRPGVKRGLEVGADFRKPMSEEDKKVLFGQRAR